jgi:hypothetical protein
MPSSSPRVFHPSIQTSSWATAAIARGTPNSGALGTVLQEGPQTAAPTEPNTAEQATIIAVVMVAHSSMVCLVSMFRSTPFHLSVLRLQTATLASRLAKLLKELVERFESELDWTWLLWCSCPDIGQALSQKM